MKRPNDIEAVVLAGGLGTRLLSVVADSSKVIALVGGRPFLAYLLDQISAAGIGRAVICTGYLGEQIEGLFGKRYGALRIDYSREREALGTGGAVALAAEKMKASRILLMNGDSYCEADLRELMQAH